MTSVLGACGAALFVVVLLVDGATRTGYSPIYHPVSALALGRRGWIQTANFLVSGAAITVGAVGALVDRAPAAGPILLGITLAVFGVAVIASGIFRMDAQRGYPPGSVDGDPATFSLRHRLHDHAGAVVFLALPVASAIGVFALSDVRWKVVSALAAVGLLYASGAFGKAWERDDTRTGLIQRAYIVPGWLWVAAVFVDSAQ